MSLKHLILTLEFVALASGAQAQADLGNCGCDPLVVMLEDQARADVICPKEATRERLLDIWGPSRPEGARILVIRKGGETTWAPAGTSPEALAASAGAVAAFTGSALERAACFSVGDFCPAPQRNALGAIQPRAGVWRSTLGDMTITGCPAQMASAVSAAAPAVLGTSEERRSFSDPFHPQSLLIDQGQQDITWVERADGGWETEFVPQVINDQQAAGASTNVSMTLEVACDTLIEGTTEINIQLPEVARSLLGVGPEGCVIQRPYQLQWVGE